MDFLPPSPWLAICFALALPHIATGEISRPAEVGAPLRATLSSTLYADNLAMRLAIGRGSSYLGLGLDSCADGAYLEGCLHLEAERGGDFSLSAGPGSASGSLRLLVDPTSTTALSGSPPVDLDRSFASRSAVVGLQAGPVFLFGIAQGVGPIVFDSRLGGSCRRSLKATAGGLSLRMVRQGYALEALACASYSEAQAPASGWRPDPYALPALGPGEAGMPLAEAAVVAEKSDDRGSARAALVGSYGSLAGPALAFRLESRRTAGPLDLRFRAAAASPSFRALFGKTEARLAGAAAEARLAMRRAASVSASVEAEAVGQGLRYAPQWGEAAAVGIVLPLDISADRFLESKFEARRPASGAGEGSWATEIKKGKAEEGGAAAIGAALHWQKTIENLVMSLCTSLAAEGGTPSFGLDIDMELFDCGSSASPVFVTGALSAGLPWGRTGLLELSVRAPEKGLVLKPVLSGAAAPSYELRLRYKASL